MRNKNTLADLILDELENSGQIIRKDYQRRLPSDTSKDYYFIHRDTGITEPIIVEYGFLDNKNDAERLKNNYKQYAEAVVRGVVEYLGLASGNTYTVEKGDSLWSIARKFNVSVNELKAANNLSSNLLNVGQILKIPVIEEPTGEYQIYTVKSGDSLYNIAKQYNTTVDNLIEYNNLDSTILNIGQKILIPLQTEELNTYTVKSGDNLYSIAKKYNTTASKLMEVNNLSTNVLSVGQKLLIPIVLENQNFVEYTVKSGDSLYSIAKKYNTNVGEIKELNNLSTSLLNIGQILRIPTSIQTYIVQSGDSLYSIGKKFNVSVDEIKRKNNLSTNLLSIGQILVL